jgi:uncharacterized protein (DUF1778 family)
MRGPQSEKVKREAGLDCTRFTVDANAYRELLARLDAPPKPNPRLLRSFRTPAPWDPQ